MAKRTGRKRASRVEASEAAQRALDAATATEPIERAPDLAVFQRQLVDGTRAMLGIDIASADLEK
jgi:hypothetical protein